MNRFRVKPQVLIAVLLFILPWGTLIWGVLWWEADVSDYRIPAKQVSATADMLHLPDGWQVVNATQTGDWDCLHWYLFHVDPKWMPHVREETYGKRAKLGQLFLSNETPQWWAPATEGDAEAYDQGTWRIVVLCPRSGHIYFVQ